ncbi:MAG TPA: hypothetical protein VJA94_24270, partial [Candidatus Angelobacter sp.]
MCTSAWAQTFELNQQSSNQRQQNQKTKAKKGAAPVQVEGQSGVWGGSIESDRYARAAGEALKKGNYTE